MTIRMGFRIAIWAVLGAVISAGWGFYFATADKSIPVGPILYALASVTQPIAAVAGWYLHLPFGLTTAVAWNAAAFAVIGVIVETFRHRHALGTAV